MERLSIAEFERLLSRGRGKAILHLQQYDAAPYRDAIRRCCLTNTAYEAQCKNHRAPYLMDAIALSGEADALCEAVIQAVHRQTEYTHDFNHLFELLGQFTRKGYKMARQAMYAWCRIHYNPRDMSPNALMPLLKIDGVQAFLFFLDPRQSGRYGNLDSESHSGFEYALEELEEMLGETETLKAFWKATEDRPALRDTFEAIYVFRKVDIAARVERRKERKQDLTALTYSEFRALINGQDVGSRLTPHDFQIWGENASDADLHAAAVDFNTLTLPMRLRVCYANIFARRAFPLDDLNRFFDLAYHTNLNRDPVETHLSSIFLRVCRHISTPRLRTFALELITNRQDTGRVVSLLANNFEEGDWALIESLFDADLDEHDYHSLGFSMAAVFEKHPSPDAVPALIRMFDANPCSRCREDVVESLVSLNALPDWMAEECRYDANLDLRAYAERGFQNVSDD